MKSPHLPSQERSHCAHRTPLPAPPAGMQRTLAAVWFFSGSADKSARSLSNFARVRGGKITVTFQLGRASTAFAFHTVEAAFQACKLRVRRPPSPGKEPEHEDAVRGLISALQDAVTGEAAKRLGSRAAWDRRGLTLDVAAWDAASRAVMRWLLTQRAAVDADFRETVLRLSGADTGTPVPLRHFARGLHYACKTTGEVVLKRDKGGRPTTAALNASLLGDDMVEIARAVVAAADAGAVGALVAAAEREAAAKLGGSVEPD